MGAIAFFGDKYGAAVRVVQAGPSSLEFCGGTHVDSLGQIGPITLLSEGSIGSNTRRIFALTGQGLAGPRRRARAPGPVGGRAVAGRARRAGGRHRPGDGAPARRREGAVAACASSRARPRPRAWPPRRRRRRRRGRPARQRARPTRCARWPRPSLRHDGVRAVVLGGLARRRQGGHRRRHGRRRPTRCSW